jgi:hypothetical protein
LLLIREEVGWLLEVAYSSLELDADGLAADAHFLVANLLDWAFVLSSLRRLRTD